MGRRKTSTRVNPQMLDPVSLLCVCRTTRNLVVLKNCFVKIEVSLIHDVVLIFALRQSDSVMHRDTHFFKIFFSNRDTDVEDKCVDTRGRREMVG